MFRTLALLLVSTTSVSAESQDFTLRVDVPLLSLDVSVTDAQGHPVGGLTRDDFEILENGIPQTIQYFGSSTAPYHAYILVDGSGSTQHKWGFMRNAIAGFSRSLKPQDRMVVGVFGEDLKTLNRWDDARRTVLAALEPLMDVESPGRTTEFYWALERVIEDGFDGISERRAVIVLTDGRDASLYQELVRTNRLLRMEDEREFRDLPRRAAQSGVALIFVAINTDENLDTSDEGMDEYKRLGIIYGDSPIPERYLEQVRLRMERLAEVSGGRILFPRSIEDLAKPFEEIAKSLSEAYSLGYAPEKDLSNADPELRRIEVRLPGLNHSIQQSRTQYRFANN
jgi:VWFA-related protein